TQIQLGWQDNSTNEEGFKVYRKIAAGGTFNYLATLPAGSQTFNDSGLTPGTVYDYHVQAFNISGYSDFVGVTTTTISTKPANLLATSGNGLVSLTWNASPSASGYNVYRG